MAATARLLGFFGFRGPPTTTWLFGFLGFGGPSASALLLRFRRPVSPGALRIALLFRGRRWRRVRRLGRPVPTAGILWTGRGLVA